MAEAVRDENHEQILSKLRGIYGRYALSARKAGMENIQPAMTLMDWFGKYEANGQKVAPPSPEQLPFVPLPDALLSQESLIAEMCKRYNDHKKKRIKPFVSSLQHCHTQLVLVDVLRVLRNGVYAYNDTRECIIEILRAYHSGWRPFNGIQKVLFAATKADHATENHRDNMTTLLDSLVPKSRRKGKRGFAIPPSIWFTSNRATEDATRQVDGQALGILKGIPRNGAARAQAHIFPGEVPAQWPKGTADGWVLGNRKYAFPEFEPKPFPERDSEEFEHLNLDIVIWELLKDCFGTAREQTDEGINTGF